MNELPTPTHRARTVYRLISGVAALAAVLALAACGATESDDVASALLPAATTQPTMTDRQLADQLNALHRQYPDATTAITVTDVPEILTLACAPGPDNFYRQDMPTVWPSLKALLARSGRCPR